MRLAYSERDLADVRDIVRNWRSRGFSGQLQTERAPEGYVSVRTSNWIPGGDPYVTIELHKVTNGVGMLGRQKVAWVSRLLTHSDESGRDPTIHGCYQSPTQWHALDRAITDVGTFLSQTRIEDYLND